MRRTSAPYPARPERLVGPRRKNDRGWCQPPDGTSPVGATGLAQVTELVEQLRGEADKRQVEGARIGLAENGGGYIGGDAAAMVMSVLEK